MLNLKNLQKRNGPINAIIVVNLLVTLSRALGLKRFLSGNIFPDILWPKEVKTYSRDQLTVFVCYNHSYHSDNEENMGPERGIEDLQQE